MPYLQLKQSGLTDFFFCLRKSIDKQHFAVPGRAVRTAMTNEP